MKRCVALITTLLIASLTSTYAQNRQRPPRPVRANSNLVKAEHRNVSYGPHKRNVLDIWLAKSDKPTPVVVFFHGGGFRAGDKSQLRPAMLNELLEAGISVAAANYRLTNTTPFPAQMHDAVRAIQFIRSNAGEWNLDKNRFAAFGGSAGTGISMWLAFHDDLAEPNSTEPILRESTRQTERRVNPPNDWWVKVGGVNLIFTIFDPRLGHARTSLRFCGPPEAGKGCGVV